MPFLCLLARAIGPREGDRVLSDGRRQATSAAKPRASAIWRVRLCPPPLTGRDRIESDVLNPGLDLVPIRIAKRNEHAPDKLVTVNPIARAAVPRTMPDISPMTGSLLNDHAQAPDNSRQ